MNAATAQEQYPQRVITLIIPSAPGGGIDSIGRVLAEGLGAKLGQTVVVENRPGGAENIGINAVAKAAPNGYTLLLSSNTVAINPALYKQLDYNVNEDLVPIGRTTALPLYLVTRSDAPFKSLKEMIAYAKQNPNKLSYGSGGVGSPLHLAMELLNSAAKLDIQHIPYKGAPAAVADLIGGTVQLIVTTAPNVEGQVQSGDLRPLANMSAPAIAAFANVPTVSEVIPGFDVSVWHGVFVPKGTPKAITDKLTATLQEVIADPKTLDQFKKLRVIPAWLPPNELSTKIKAEQADWAATIKAAGIPLVE
jgi:tripartite-type tricarboxylate transporter receptor subunit TctC